MGQVALPVWVNLIWMSISAITLIGAIIWTIFIFWPYLRETKKMQLEGLNLAKKSSDDIGELIRKLDPMVEKAKETADRIGEIADRFDQKLSDDFLGRVEDAMDSITLSKKPLPVPKSLGGNGPAKPRIPEPKKSGANR